MAVSPAPFPYAVVLAPMSHRPDLPSLVNWEREALAGLLADILARFDRLSIPYDLWVHQAPTDGLAWPNPHLHVEISGVLRPINAAELGSGVFFNTLAPHEAAVELKAAGPAPTP